MMNRFPIRRHSLTARSLGTMLCVIIMLGPNRAGAETALVLPPMVTPEARQAIDRGLNYLAQTQSREGMWRSQGNMGEFPVAMTALAGLALLASGSTTTEGKYAPNVSRAVGFILRCSDKDGLISRIEEESRSMYGHGFSMLLLGQVYGMEPDTQRRAQIHQVLQRAVTLTGRAQSPLGGWLYTPDMKSDEGSVTITQLQGLRSIRDAGVAVPKPVVDKALDYLKKSWLPNGGITYRADRQGGPRPPITAAAVACWYNAGQYDNPMAVKSLSFIKEELGRGGRRSGSWGHYFYAHFYMAQVMWLAGPENWEWYFPAMRDWLLSSQDTDGAWEGDYVGKVYGTAIALVILQLPYQHLPILQR